MLQTLLALTLAAAPAAASATSAPAKQPAVPSTPASAKAFAPDANLERSAVPDGFKWKLAPLFKDDAAFEKGLSDAAAGRKALAQFKGQLARPEQLRAGLERYFQVRLLTNQLTLYASLRLETDQKDPRLQAMSERALQAMNGLLAEASFLRQEILRLDDAALASAYAKEPKLVEYKPYLDEQRRRRARVLSAEAERILALAKDNLWAEQDLNELPSDFEKAFDAALSDISLPSITDEAGRSVELTLSSYPKYRSSPERRVRREAVEKLFATLRQHQDVFAATLAGQVNLNVFYARARGYDTALDAYLDKDNVDPAVYRNLIKTVRDNLGPLHRYVALRRKALAIPEVRIYDLYAPIVPKVEMRFPFEQAREILPVALAPLGETYVAALNTGLDPAQGWLDLYPNKHKRSGAFCSSVFGTHPFVKMNYLDDLEGLSVLAHEYGHAMHSWLSMREQPYVTANYTTFVAEIASTVNQKLLSDWLLAREKRREARLYLLAKLVEEIRTTIYRQTLFAEFELALHTAAERGEPLTAQFMNETYQGLLRTYYGAGFDLGKDDAVEWAYVPHFYYKYYVSAYATGLSAGIALAEAIQQGKPGARDAYLKMLSSGCSKPPLTLLRDAGVDLTRPQAIVAAARLMDATVKEMDALLSRP